MDAPRRQGFVTSLAVVALSMLFVDHRRAGTGLVPLSVAMLVVGGGFGPPVLGMLAGPVAGGTRLITDARVLDARAHGPPHGAPQAVGGGTQLLLAAAIAQVAAAALLLPGVGAAVALCCPS